MLQVNSSSVYKSTQVNASIYTCQSVPMSLDVLVIPDVNGRRDMHRRAAKADSLAVRFRFHLIFSYFGPMSPFFVNNPLH